MISLSILLLIILSCIIDMKYQYITRLTSLILIWSGILAWNSFDLNHVIFNGLLQINNITHTFETAIYFMGAMLILIKEMDKNVSNYYSFIILLTTLGGIIMISSYDLTIFFIALELQSLALYILATIYKDSESSTGAGLKYFLLGGLSSSFIIFGCGILYAYTGCTNIESIYLISNIIFGYDSIEGGIIIISLILIFSGLLFKIGAAPFYFWSPDVYDGTPTIVTAWISIIPKISILIFILLVTIPFNSMCYNNIIITQIFMVSSILSLIIGSVLGIIQYKLKRLMAYSTISHLGFILLGLSLNNHLGSESVIIYLLQYSITNIALFYILVNLDFDYINQIKGLYQNEPFLALCFGICLFSFAGIPPLLGFFAKLSILSSALHNGFILISIIGILSSVISASYYIKLIKTIYFDAPILHFVKHDQNGFLLIRSNDSLIISGISLFLILFLIKPTLLLNIGFLITQNLYIL